MKRLILIHLSNFLHDLAHLNDDNEDIEEEQEPTEMNVIGFKI